MTAPYVTEDTTLCDIPGCGEPAAMEMAFTGKLRCFGHDFTVEEKQVEREREREHERKREDGGESAPTRPRLRVLDTRHLITTPPPPIDWLADGIYAKGKFTLFGGREKGGKSLVQMTIAIAMASGGGTVAGITVAPGKVLIVDGENGEEELHRRVHSLGFELAHAENLVLVEARAFDLRTDLGQVADLIDGHAPDLVLLDSFRALWRGSERDEEEIAAALYPLSDLAHSRGVAVGLTHHATKGDSGDYRGSTAIGAVPDWICVLSRDRDDADKTRRRLTTPYARFAPPRDDRWLQIRSDGDDGPVWLETCDAYVPERDAPVRDEIEAGLRKFIDKVPGATVPIEGGTVAPSHVEPNSGKVPGATTLIGDGTLAPSWTIADLARAIGRDSKDGTVRRAIDALAAEGVIYRGDDKRWRRQGAFFAQGALFTRNGHKPEHTPEDFARAVESLEPAEPEEDDERRDLA